MSVRSFPFAGQDSAEDDYYRLHRESGIISGLDLTLNGLGWSLSVGEATSGGSMMLVEDAPATGASVATSGANPRRDMLVARRTMLPDGDSETVPVLIQGATAITPADPTPTQETVGVFEEPLFSWQVPGGGGTVITGVRDLRRAANTTPRIIPSMAARPTTDRYLGTRVQPRDRPSTVYVWDGTRWVQEGLLSGVVSLAPAGSYVSRIEDTATANTGNATGGFNVTIPFGGFSAAPLKVSMEAGDSAGELAYIIPVGVNHTDTTIHGSARRVDGTGVPTTNTFRVNYTVVGYNT